MRILQIFLIVLSLFFGTLYGQAQQVKDLYQAAISDYQKGDFNQAQNGFRKALDSSPNNSLILYNLGLSFFKLKKLGPAVAAWRKAIHLNPLFSPAQQALALGLKSLPNQTYDESTRQWEEFRKNVLSKFSIHHAFFVTLIFLFISGFYLLKFLGQRKSAFEEEKSLPHVPYTGIVAGLIFLFAFGISLCKFIDLNEPRATVIGEKAIVFTGPSEEDNQVFELLEGSEVIVYQVQNNWTQIANPGGLSGWVKSKLIFHTSGNSLW